MKSFKLYKEVPNEEKAQYTKKAFKQSAILFAIAIIGFALLGILLVLAN